MDVSTAVSTPHALEQIAARAVDREDVEGVLLAPTSVEAVRAGRISASAAAEIDGKSYLIRVFVDIDRTPPEIVTAYRTSKIRKYGSQP